LPAQKIIYYAATLSMQIQKLEDELGVLILTDQKQPVIPTSIGGVQIIEKSKNY